MNNSPEQLEIIVNDAIASMKGDRNLHRVLSYLLNMRGIGYYGIGEDVRKILGMSPTPLQPIVEAWEPQESKPMPKAREPHHSSNKVHKPKSSSQPKVNVP